MNTFSTGSSLRFGWETFKKRPWFFIGVTFLVMLISVIVKPAAGQQGSAAWDVWHVVSFVLLILLDMGSTALMLHAHDDAASAKVSDLWHPHPFLNYLGAVILSAIAIVAGLFLFVVPGIFFILMWMFVKYSVIDKNLGPIEAMQYSARIGGGKRWELLLFLFAVILLNVCGAILLLVGLLVTIPVTALAMTHAYRTLSGGTSIPAATTA